MGLGHSDIVVTGTYFLPQTSGGTVKGQLDEKDVTNKAANEVVVPAGRTEGETNWI